MNKKIEKRIRRKWYHKALGVEERWLKADGSIVYIGGILGLLSRTR
ncbi:hypothetical protein JCM19232_878 [Vibrio ishigakensis]|uniref:Uncharacterized protein n=1 Tax=Vibrio ishigakensis TaxID=1481914 RepID=A0A0B8P187_9VIBR|nr:hypothetical protein JCM19232_878 [Vibrio ishigakensis]